VKKNNKNQKGERYCKKDDNMKKMKKEMIPALPTNNYY